MPKNLPFSDGSDPVSRALAEDLGDGDITSAFFVPADAQTGARIVAREEAILAGMEVAVETFLRVDASLSVTVRAVSGATVGVGDAVLEVTGLSRSILSAERVVLNFLQQLSGIATLTNHFVKAVAATPVAILDTRKTTPGLRALEKAAVHAGGGTNHRFGLYDMILIKDNHLRAMATTAGLQRAINRVRRERPGVRIEIEADTLEQVELFAALDGIDWMLLDNMRPEILRAAVALVNGRVKLESSGGITLLNVAAIAATGVDAISVGALTHSAPAVDFSLEFD